MSDLNHNVDLKLVFQITQDLLKLGFDNLVYEPLDEVLTTQIQIKIGQVHAEFEKSKLQGVPFEFEKVQLSKLLEWFNVLVLRFINFLVKDLRQLPLTEQLEEINSPSYMWHSKMERTLMTSFTSMWTGHIIDLVHVFPDSTPVLRDLKKAVESCEM